jgi:hypothetical protein
VVPVYYADSISKMPRIGCRFLSMNLFLKLPIRGFCKKKLELVSLISNLLELSMLPLQQDSEVPVPVPVPVLRVDVENFDHFPDTGSSAFNHGIRIREEFFPDTGSRILDPASFW